MTSPSAQLPARLKADCSACVALCCVIPPFDASQGFGFDKPAETPCQHLCADHRCGIHEAFNQENPTNRAQRSLYADDGQKGIWGQFESAVADQIEAGGGRAILFAGPVLKDFFASIKMDGNELHIPKKFWKVVVVPDGPKKKPKLLAYGYVFSQVDVQKKYGFGFEGLELPRFSKNRIKLADLSAMTGVIFSKVVLDAEQA